MVLVFTIGALEGLQKLRVPDKPLKVTVDIIPRVCIPLQKGQYGVTFELLRQPPDLVFQICSSASLSASYVCPELFSGAESHTGPWDGYIRHARDDHSVTLPTVGAGPALLSSYRRRQAE